MAAGTARRWGLTLGHFGVVGLFTLFTAFPFYWMLVTTFKRTSDLLKRGNNPFVYNEAPTLENLRLLLQKTPYVRCLVNAALVGVPVVVITLILAIPSCSPHRPDK